MKIIDASKFEVLGEFGNGYFSTNCPVGTPSQMSLANEGYSVSAIFKAGNNPQIFIGLEVGADTFQLDAPGWRLNPPGSVHKKSEVWTKHSFVEGNTLEFEIVAPDGTVKKHSFEYELIDCVCKTYDAI